VKGHGDRQTFGIAVCDGHLYVIENMSDIVTAYEDTPPFKPVPHASIRITGMSPTDIVSFVAKKQLYVTDPRTLCVWQITLPHPPKQFARNIEAWSLFVESNSRKLLATTHSMLLIYALDDARQLFQVQLSSRIDALHSVMTSTGRIMVCHTGSENNNEFHQISEVDMSGSVLRAYGSSRGSGPDRLYQPTHLALDGDRRLIVADNCNGQVLVLSAELKLLRVLLKAEKFNCVIDGEGQFHDVNDDKPSKDARATVRNWPYRLQYVPSTRSLFVALSNGAVNVCVLRKERRRLDKIWRLFCDLKK